MVKKIKRKLKDNGGYSSFGASFLSAVITIVIIISIALFMFGACSSSYSPDYNAQSDIDTVAENGNTLAANQPTLSIDYSVTRFLLQERDLDHAGKYEDMKTLESPTQLQTRYVVLFSGNTAIGQYAILGHVVAENSYLTPSYNVKTHYDDYAYEVELPDTDGTYGENFPTGAFFLTIGYEIVSVGNLGYLVSRTPFANVSILNAT